MSPHNHVRSHHRDTMVQKDPLLCVVIFCPTCSELFGGGSASLFTFRHYDQAVDWSIPQLLNHHDSRVYQSFETTSWSSLINTRTAAWCEAVGTRWKETRVSLSYFNKKLQWNGFIFPNFVICGFVQKRWIPQYFHVHEEDDDKLLDFAVPYF